MKTNGPARCTETVSQAGARGLVGRCSRVAIHNNGTKCKQHSKAAKSLREMRASNHYKASVAERQRQMLLYGRPLIAALREIAAGKHPFDVLEFVKKTLTDLDIPLTEPTDDE